MSFEEAMQLMTDETTLKLSPGLAVKCYAQSLQGCPDFCENLDKQVLHISFTEFLEMIVRFADQVIRREALITEKLEQVLTEWLTLVGRPREAYQLYKDESSSENEKEM